MKQLLTPFFNLFLVACIGLGLGVNRLTPGQKNVLIFGGLALGFAFFLSLYSLR